MEILALLIHGHWRTLVCLLLFSGLISIASATVCDACFSVCKGENLSECDCPVQNVTTCEGPFCFAKLDVFTNDGLTSIIKGCSNEFPGSESGCFHSGYEDSVACYCSGDHCNRAEALDHFRPRSFPKFKCCECDYDEDNVDKCVNDGCKQTCSGSYCFYDFQRKQQSCGHGLSPTLQNYFTYRKGESVSKMAEGSQCLHAVGDPFAPSYVFGCICHGNKCNDVVNMTTLYESDVAAEANAKASENTKVYHRCYALRARGPAASNEGAYTRATHCEAEYCFVSYSTSQVVLSEVDFAGNFDDGSKEYEGPTTEKTVFEESTPTIDAGCIRATDESNLKVGCSAEWRESPEKPLQKHCICRGHMCNYYTQISEQDLAKYIAHPTGRKLYEEKVAAGEEDSVELTIRAQPATPPLVSAGNSPSQTSLLLLLCYALLRLQ